MDVAEFSLPVEVGYGGNCRQFQQVNRQLLWNQCMEAANFMTHRLPSLAPPPSYLCELIVSASISGKLSGKSGLDISTPVQPWRRSWTLELSKVAGLKPQFCLSAAVQPRKHMPTSWPLSQCQRIKSTPETLL